MEFGTVRTSTATHRSGGSEHACAAGQTDSKARLTRRAETGPIQVPRGHPKSREEQEPGGVS